MRVAAASRRPRRRSTRSTSGSRPTWWPPSRARPRRSSAGSSPRWRRRRRSKRRGWRVPSRPSRSSSRSSSACPPRPPRAMRRPPAPASWRWRARWAPRTMPSTIAMAWPRCASWLPRSRRGSAATSARCTSRRALAQVDEALRTRAGSARCSADPARRIAGPARCAPVAAAVVAQRLLAGPAARRWPCSTACWRGWPPRSAGFAALPVDERLPPRRRRDRGVNPSGRPRPRSGAAGPNRRTAAGAAREPRVPRRPRRPLPPPGRPAAHAVAARR